jgi:GDP-L-fucose synthase
MLFDLAGRRVFVVGHRGMVGSAIVRRLASERCEILTADRAKVDLTRQAETEAWLAATRSDALFLAAARVGGIHANDTRRDRGEPHRAGTRAGRSTVMSANIPAS